MKLASSHNELEVFILSFDTAMDVFRISKTFPDVEKYALTDQIRRSSRSVSANIAESFRKRRYEKAFISKLSDSETEAAETQVWLKFALECEYINKDIYSELTNRYDLIIGKIINMINTSSKWCR